MARIRDDFRTGRLTDNPLLAAATTANSAEFASLPVVAAPDFLLLILGPDGDPLVTSTAPEIVKVTAHLSGHTDVTVVRGYKGAARDHPQNEVWISGFIAEDFTPEASGSPDAALYWMGAH